MTAVTLRFVMRTLPSDPIVAVEPDYSHFDTAEDMYRDAVKWGLTEELRGLLCQDCTRPSGHETRGPIGQETKGLLGDGATLECGGGESRSAALRIVRDLVYELAAAKNRDLAVDLLIHVTGIAEFGASSLRDYGRRHGCTHEWFRRQAEAMRKRLDLPPLPSQRSEKIRTEYRLLNRRNGSGRAERPEE